MPANRDGVPVGPDPDSGGTAGVDHVQDDVHPQVQPSLLLLWAQDVLDWPELLPLQLQGQSPPV